MKLRTLLPTLSEDGVPPAVTELPSGLGRFTQPGVGVAGFVPLRGLGLLAPHIPESSACFCMGRVPALGAGGPWSLALASPVVLPASLSPIQSWDLHGQALGATPFAGPAKPRSPAWLREGWVQVSTLRNRTLTGAFQWTSSAAEAGATGTLLPATPTGGVAGATVLAEREVELIWLGCSIHSSLLGASPCGWGQRSPAVAMRGPSCVVSCGRSRVSQPPHLRCSAFQDPCGCPGHSPLRASRTTHPVTAGSGSGPRPCLRRGGAHCLWLRIS